MNSTTQWSILWNTALFPPQEMLPPDSLFCTPPCSPTTASNSEHLFGFTPCIPTTTEENSESTPHKPIMAETYSMDNFYDASEDFSALFAIEELASFL